jgi:prevent-host-death family protein
MKVYTYSQARQNLATVLNQSRDGKVLIRRRGGESFAIVPQRRQGSPFDVPGVKTQADTLDILSAVRESRAKTSQKRRI